MSFLDTLFNKSIKPWIWNGPEADTSALSTGGLKSILQPPKPAAPIQDIQAMFLNNPGGLQGLFEALKPLLQGSQPSAPQPMPSAPPPMSGGGGHPLQGLLAQLNQVQSPSHPPLQQFPSYPAQMPAGPFAGGPAPMASPAASGETYESMKAKHGAAAAREWAKTQR